MFWCSSVGAGAAGAYDDQRAAIALSHRQPHGPSFDCTVRLSPSERRICDSPALAKLDAKLAESFANDVVLSQRALSVADEESAWLAERDRCASDACIANAYRARIATLDHDELREEHVVAHHTEDRGFLKGAVPKSVLAQLRRMAGRKCFSHASPIDLGDGRTSYVAWTCDDCKPVAEAIVFHAEGHSFREVYRAPDCYVSLIFEGLQEERRNGLRRIWVFSRSSASMHYDDFLDYDGSQYRHVATIEELGDAHIVIRRDRSTIRQWLTER